MHETDIGSNLYGKEEFGEKKINHQGSQREALRVPPKLQRRSKGITKE
jgi:hypothetical protein